MSPLSKVAGISALALVLGGLALVVACAPGSRPYALGESVAATTPAPAMAEVDRQPAVATLGNLRLSAAELGSMLNSRSDAERQQLLGDREALDRLIRARLAEMALLEQASAQGWPERPEIQEMTQAATQQILLRTYLQSVSQVPADYPDEQTLERAYESAKSNLQTPALYRVSQIFLAVNTAQDEEPVRKKAIELAGKAKASGADFASLAREHSDDQSTAQAGGDSGLLPLQQYVPAMRQVLGQLRVDEVSAPLRGEAGYHILKLTELQPARQATLAEVRNQLLQALRAQRQDDVAKAYLEGLISSATLSIDDGHVDQALETVR